MSRGPSNLPVFDIGSIVAVDGLNDDLSSPPEDWTPLSILS